MGAPQEAPDPDWRGRPGLSLEGVGVSQAGRGQDEGTGRLGSEQQSVVPTEMSNVSWGGEAEDEPGAVCTVLKGRSGLRSREHLGLVLTALGSRKGLQPVGGLDQIRTQANCRASGGGGEAPVTPP